MRRLTISIFIITITFFLISSEPVFAWRSSLYPGDWQLGYKDAENRFLHDFSYAGYHKGEEPISDITRPIFNVADYGADGSDEIDDTDVIQNAINAAQDAGGGVVYFPEGTYFVTPKYYGKWSSDPVGRPWALLIMRSNVVIRGQGADRTHIFYNDTYSKRGGIILVNPRIQPERGLWEPNAFDFNKSDWLTPPAGTEKISVVQDILFPTTILQLDQTDNLNAGDWIVIYVARKDNQPFLNYHNNSINGYGLRYYRQITSVNNLANTVTIDVPTRYPLYAEWQPVVYKTFEPIREVGIEDVSFGMLETDNLSNVGTSYVIYFKNTINGWVRNVETYPPTQNDCGYDYIGGGAPEELKFHIHSYGIEFRDSRNITIENCDFRNPQNHGGGGNGYAYIIQGSDSLIRDSKAYNCRHNFSFKGMSSTGNVLYNCTAGFTPNYPRVRDGDQVNGMTLQSDFHMFFSHANLVDNMILDGDSFLAEYRGGSHSIAASEDVFWNTNVAQSHIIPHSGSSGEAIVSDQWGWGYVIGMQGLQTDKLLNVYGSQNPGDPHRPDFVEPQTLRDNPYSGDGKGETLEPQSLYLDQLARRLGPQPSSSPGPSPSPSPSPSTIADILTILNNWGNSGGEGDFYVDGKVNGMDFGWVVKDWATQ